MSKFILLGIAMAASLSVYTTGATAAVQAKDVNCAECANAAVLARSRTTVVRSGSGRTAVVRRGPRRTAVVRSGPRRTTVVHRSRGRTTVIQPR
jgi:hypothetical protein